jgi:hypothetical protein
VQLHRAAGARREGAADLFGVLRDGSAVEHDQGRDELRLRSRGLWRDRDDSRPSLSLALVTRDPKGLDRQISTSCRQREMLLERPRGLGYGSFVPTRFRRFGWMIFAISICASPPAAADPARAAAPRQIALPASWFPRVCADPRRARKATAIARLNCRLLRFVGRWRKRDAPRVARRPLPRPRAPLVRSVARPTDHETMTRSVVRPAVRPTAGGIAGGSM